MVAAILAANVHKGGSLDLRIHLSIKEVRKKVNGNGETYKRMVVTNRVRNHEHMAERKNKKRRVVYVCNQVCFCLIE